MARGGTRHALRGEEATVRHTHGRARPPLRTTPSEAREGRKRKAGGRAGGDTRRRPPTGCGGGGASVEGAAAARNAGRGPTWRHPPHTNTHTHASPRRLGAMWHGEGRQTHAGRSARRRATPRRPAGRRRKHAPPKGAAPRARHGHGTSRTPAGRGEAEGPRGARCPLGAGARTRGPGPGHPPKPQNPKDGRVRLEGGSRGDRGGREPRARASERASSLLLPLPLSHGRARAGAPKPPQRRTQPPPNPSTTCPQTPTRLSLLPTLSSLCSPNPSHTWPSQRGGRGVQGREGQEGGGGRGGRARQGAGGGRGAWSMRGLEGHRHLHLGGRRANPALGTEPCGAGPARDTPSQRPPRGGGGGD